jgi:ApaG protein
MYRAVTRQIEVTVEPNFLPERSSVDRGQYFWSYTVVITNTGGETVQLRTRHWIITDATGRKQEVRGEGVVGEQPVLAPGERFEYTSGVPLPTASGFMTGCYQMVSESGERFEIAVPTFSLDSPDNRRVLNYRGVGVAPSAPANGLSTRPRPIGSSVHFRKSAATRS